MLCYPRGTLDAHIIYVYINMYIYIYLNIHIYIYTLFVWALSVWDSIRILPNNHLHKENPEFQSITSNHKHHLSDPFGGAFAGNLERA